MGRLRRFLCLPAAERRLLIKAALLLAVIRLGVRLLPFRILRRLLTRVANTPLGPRQADHHSAERIAWAVEAASRHTPGVESCLVQALTAQVLLNRRGYPAPLHIGVTRGEQGQFQAHAWVESGGKVVIGRTELEYFTRLAVFEGAGPSEGEGLNGFRNYKSIQSTISSEKPPD